MHIVEEEVIEASRIPRRGVVGFQHGRRTDEFVPCVVVYLILAVILLFKISSFIAEDCGF